MTSRNAEGKKATVSAALATRQKKQRQGKSQTVGVNSIKRCNWAKRTRPAEARTDRAPITVGAKLL